MKGGDRMGHKDDVLLDRSFYGEMMLIDGNSERMKRYEINQ